MTTRNAAKKAITDERFIAVYQAAKDTAAAAEKLDMKAQHVVNRAARLRAKGVPLKKMPNARGGRTPEQIEQLADLARKTAPKT